MIEDCLAISRLQALLQDGFLGQPSAWSALQQTRVSLQLVVHLKGYPVQQVLRRRHPAVVRPAPPAAGGAPGGSGAPGRAARQQQQRLRSAAAAAAAAGAAASAGSH
jgi:hypothetical protein